VTVPGDPAGVWLEGERRGVTVYAPGGYHWRPDNGQELLVLKAGDRGEKPCALGTPQDDGSLEETLAPGEVAIAAGKARLILRQNGVIEVKGILAVNGTVVGPLPPEPEGEAGC